MSQAGYAPEHNQNSPEKLYHGVHGSGDAWRVQILRTETWKRQKNLPNE